MGTSSQDNSLTKLSLGTIRNELVRMLSSLNLVTSVTFVGSRATAEKPGGSVIDLDVVTIVNHLVPKSLRIVKHAIGTVATEIKSRFNYNIKLVFYHGPILFEGSIEPLVYIHAVIDDPCSLNKSCSIVTSAWSTYAPTWGKPIKTLMRGPKPSSSDIAESRYGPHHCIESLKRGRIGVAYWGIDKSRVINKRRYYVLRGTPLLLFSKYSIKQNTRALARLSEPSIDDTDSAAIELLYTDRNTHELAYGIEEFTEFLNNLPKYDPYEQRLETVVIAQTITLLQNIWERMLAIK